MIHAMLLTKNCLDLTRICVQSLREQDLHVPIHIYDNESTDGTREWIRTRDDLIDHSIGADFGVSGGWNFVLDILFGMNGEPGWNADKVIVCNNDTFLSPWTVRMLDKCHVDFVTGVSLEDMNIVMTPREQGPLTGGPDFSCFMLTKKAYEKVGKFDENMQLYAQDMDWHVRAHRAGVECYNSHLPFFHSRSSTLRKANPLERQRIEDRANMDRAEFKRKWGVGANDPEYADLFKAELFGVK